jgi:hypothetical protein
MWTLVLMKRAFGKRHQGIDPDASLPLSNNPSTVNFAA